MRTVLITPKLTIPVLTPSIFMGAIRKQSRDSIANVYNSYISDTISQDLAGKNRPYQNIFYHANEASKV